MPDLDVADMRRRETAPAAVLCDAALDNIFPIF
jgi:hypothetical protein